MLGETVKEGEDDQSKMNNNDVNGSSEKPADELKGDKQLLHDAKKHSIENKLMDSEDTPADNRAKIERPPPFSSKKKNDKNLLTSANDVKPLACSDSAINVSIYLKLSK